MVPAQEQGPVGTSHPLARMPQALDRKVGWKGRAGRDLGQEVGQGPQPSGATGKDPTCGLSGVPPASWPLMPSYLFLTLSPRMHPRKGKALPNGHAWPPPQGVCMTHAFSPRVEESEAAPRITVHQLCPAKREVNSPGVGQTPVQLDRTMSGLHSALKRRSCLGQIPRVQFNPESAVPEVSKWRAGIAFD